MEELGSKIEEKQAGNGTRIHLAGAPRPDACKNLSAQIVDPFVKKLKALIKTVLVRCFGGWDNYDRLNTTKKLYQENERPTKKNEKLTADNEVLRAENKDYKLLQKVFGSRQPDNLVAQAKEAKQSKKRDLHFRNNSDER